MNHLTTMVALAAFCGLADAALAQQAQQPMTFRLAAGDRNPSACFRADATMSRPHTVTIDGNVAHIKSSGGINDTAKLVSPGVYRTKWSLAAVTYDIEVNASASPATISVTEPKIGCKWSGQAA